MSKDFGENEEDDEDFYLSSEEGINNENQGTTSDSASSDVAVKKEDNQAQTIDFESESDDESFKCKSEADQSDRGSSDSESDQSEGEDRGEEQDICTERVPNILSECFWNLFNEAAVIEPDSHHIDFHSISKSDLNPVKMETNVLNQRILADFPSLNPLEIIERLGGLAYTSKNPNIEESASFNDYFRGEITRLHNLLILQIDSLIYGRFGAMSLRFWSINDS